MEWARAQRDVPRGFDVDHQLGWRLVRYVNSLAGRRRLIAKAIFLAPMAIVVGLLIFGALRS